MKIAIVGSGNGAVTAAVDMVDKGMMYDYIVVMNLLVNLMRPRKRWF